MIVRSLLVAFAVALLPAAPAVAQRAPESTPRQAQPSPVLPLPQSEAPEPTAEPTAEPAPTPVRTRSPRPVVRTPAPVSPAPAPSRTTPPPPSPSSTGAPPSSSPAVVEPSTFPVVAEEPKPTAGSSSDSGDPVQRIVVALLGLAALLGAGGAYGLHVTRERP